MEAMIIEPIGTSEKCATFYCRFTAQYRMEAGGIGSNYCESCMMKIEKLKGDRLGDFMYHHEHGWDEHG